MIDASQSAGALEIDVERLRPDFLVSVGYKWLLGPFALGYLWVGPDQRDGAPIEQNWILREGARDFSRLVDYRDSYEPGARRFDVGQRTNFQLVPMAIARSSSCSSGRSRASGRRSPRPPARSPTGPPSSASSRSRPRAGGRHLLGIGLTEELRSRVVPALREAGCFAALRGDSLRLAPHLHNTPDEVERLLGALGAIAGADQPSADQRVHAAAAASSAGPSASAAAAGSQSCNASPATSVPMKASPAPSVETTSTAGAGASASQAPRITAPRRRA